MKIVTFAASNSSKSINKELIRYAATFLTGHDIEMIDINDFKLPIYSADLEEKHGVPDAASDFLNHIEQADALLISYAEHNGNYTAAYKNLFDWASRKKLDVYHKKPIIMLSTSPGPNGANTVLSMAKNTAHFYDGTVIASLSIPSFYDNYDQENMELKDESLKTEFVNVLNTFNNVKI
ncbi:NADPH-dependent FMN reductase [Curvivirga aplysinae]|uniref:NADPH-dependent FMN reductase n=1 Tax=Curvivirga aplysinae TaxID=2529852 RepID=UPI0012BCAA4A|nr:NAD(P)H-dependent oxidoreductase [Curvivirga aplysinae]MTI11126.1 NADPH-dependent oxidoreductase [Curvivirga aplysinae]